ncbi:MAG TPA: hypothetical protein VMX36_13490 [Sedimentisphaerales bacterium]|nr:hypothetical protein [Sedimentisphaerales bacterium]
MKILKFAIKHWFQMFLTVAGTAIGGWLLWLYRTHLKNWLISEHSLELYGWLWILVFGLFLFLIIYSLQCVLRGRGRLKDPKDVRNVLSKWWRHCTEQNSKQKEFTLYFSSIDDREKLKKGSAKKYLREIVNDANWSIVREGPKTLTVKRKEYTVTVGLDGPVGF